MGPHRAVGQAGVIASVSDWLVSVWLATIR